MTLLEVAVSAPVRQTFTYGLSGRQSPVDDAAASYIGRRVLVPFGSRQATGYVVGIDSQDEPDFKVKNISRFIDELPLFPPDLVEFFRWVSNYYHHPLAQVIKTALPGGLTAAVQKIIRVTEKGTQADAAVFTTICGEPWFDTLQQKHELTTAESTRILQEKPSAKNIKRLVAAGFLEISTVFKKDQVGIKREVCYRLGREAVLLPVPGSAEAPEPGAWEDLAGKHLKKAEIKSLDLLQRLTRQSGQPDVPRREFIQKYPYGATVLPQLIETGLVEQHSRRIFRSPLGDLLPHYPEPEKLSDEQQTVLQEIYKALDAGAYQAFLLHGITGSGKTEVYLRAAEKVLATGGSVLVLVPEIALATQVEAHFVSRFEETVALLHSGLSQGERYDEWWRILSGEAKIVIGARSAVFAPLVKPGLIIVDEEHEGGYKQDDHLRYNGRDLALVRAKLNNSVAILGSATPSITSFFHARSGKYRLLSMNQRIGDRQLPVVALVDIKKGRAEMRKGSLFHPLLEQALQETLSRKEQTILLLNRRGFSTSMICQDCGTMLECRHCRVCMNLHKRSRTLLCHYCGYQVGEKTFCRACRSENLQPIGFGTERVEEQVRNLLPEARIARLDSDVAADRKHFLSVLQGVSNREIDVLVGTQIIAKGLHFPGVTLVGIVLADSGLGFPDFRAAEKTYQLIAQVTGRAGRGSDNGRVIVQTMQPEHYAIGLAAEHRYDALVNKEIAIREGPGFPPFSRLVFVLVEHREERLARQLSTRIADDARGWCSRHDGSSSINILGPAPAPLEKLRDHYRWQILVKGSHLATLHDLAEHLVFHFGSSRKGRVIIDIDPENMM